MKIPKLITMGMIWEEIQNVKLMFGVSQENKIANELQEFSLHQTAKILKKSTETLRTMAEKKEIESLIEERPNAKDGITFMFLPKHIRDYQERRKYKGRKLYREHAKFDIDNLINSAIDNA